MKPHKHTLPFIILIVLFSCKNEIVEPKKSKPNKIVLISVNAPKTYMHLMKQDSVGKVVKDSSGRKAFYQNNGFTYLDYMNNVQTWLPKPKVNDTLAIECYSDYLELSTNDFFTRIKKSFLVKNGDTIIFDFEDNIPKAKITNRNVNDVELNYNGFRLKKLFDNKYTSHYLVFGNLFISGGENYEKNSIEYYLQANKDFEKEIDLLDSLKRNNIISPINYHYRKDALNMLMEKHKKLKNIKNWLARQKSLENEEIIEQVYGFDLSKTDSLMKFSFFRDYLIQISKYDLDMIEENNGNSGAFYIDSRIRFDSILQDKRFNHTAKNYLLFDAYDGIGRNFRVKDKERYFKKLQENTSNLEKLNQVVEAYKIDFSKSDKLVLTTLKNDTLTFSEVLNNNKGKWLYVDFWASWCKPCRETMPESKILKSELEKENIEFVYLSVNDKKEKWKKAIEHHEISDSQNYFIENGNTSMVIEDLGIKTIPHYLIYNDEGDLVNGYAKRPGQGAKMQLEKLMANQ
ncbi:TlpA disulfide reductase family protein [Muricauda sp. 334s03]|uniref:TlpA disulfide reductase family protein n=1 Tax=Flagellimonas yonaguniensis TaxID=3031325 RepID=A0ABT5XWK1_9FLAO|nr:TlpA disulfide reductase family protein [[Muricauda] yonaguniensis]MDF0715564.1 TlpA disulfide reductase family protein [[Muricauda] yonaguniensis]